MLKDLGIDVTVGGFLGKENQDGFQHLFSELGIANRFQVVPGRTRINVKLTEKDGEVTDLNFSGFDVSAQDGNALPPILSLAGPVRYGLRQRQPACGRRARSLYALDERSAHSLPVHYFRQQSRSAGGRSESRARLVKPNRRELEIWAGRKLPTLEDVIEAAHACVNRALLT